MRDVRVEPFSVRLKEPLGTAKGEIDERRGFLVGIETDDGVRGVGEATPLPEWTESYVECRARLAELSDAADRGYEFDGATLGPATRHAVNLARMDAEARAQGKALHEWLAGQFGTRNNRAGRPATVPVNATVGDGSVDETVAAAENAVADGFDCLKLKVGAQSLETDEKRVRAVRDAVGDEIALRADANGAWDRETAERAVDRLAALEFAYVEQPLPTHELSGYTELRNRGVDVALDETLYDSSVSLPLNLRDYADVLVLKPMALGGPGPTLSLARYLRRSGVTPVVTTTVDAAVARAAAVHVAAAIPDIPACGLATGDLLAEDLVDDPVAVTDGEIAVPDGPGIAGDAFDHLLWD
ncbi:o-succinylbenzoate synthase [Haloprofundus marisrubri]|uniref:o-succinylbenzoate synthase n=1 Tax=Haloprofundus marisrubri TaxID=1514971 RepID=A0A0W1R9Y4_9EURY|nr:o-succinylbenzoate synthase [Haloprofundus marisrubri]KTG10252.1 o-succinylbenzoate synthase [Haloprofundus marisrubri]